MSNVPVLYQCNQALQCLRNKANKEFPSTLINSTTSHRRVNRNINQVTKDGHNGWRIYHGRGRGSGCHGHINEGSGGRGTWINKTRSESKIVTIADSSKIELHPSFYFSNDVIRKMNKEDFDWMGNERRPYRKCHCNQSFAKNVRKVVRIGDQQPHKSLISATPNMSSHSSNINSSNTSTIVNGR